MRSLAWKRWNKDSSKIEPQGIAAERLGTEWGGEILKHLSKGLENKNKIQSWLCRRRQERDFKKAVWKTTSLKNRERMTQYPYDLYLEICFLNIQESMYISKKHTHVTTQS